MKISTPNLRFGVALLVDIPPYQVKLTVYDILGREVAVLMDEQRSAGFFTAEWDGNNSIGANVSSGVYFYRMEAHATDGGGSFAEIRKAVMIK